MAVAQVRQGGRPGGAGVVALSRYQRSARSRSNWVTSSRDPVSLRTRGSRSSASFARRRSVSWSARSASWRTSERLRELRPNRSNRPSASILRRYERPRWCGGVRRVGAVGVAEGSSTEEPQVGAVAGAGAAGAGAVASGSRDGTGVGAEGPRGGAGAGAGGGGAGAVASGGRDGRGVGGGDGGAAVAGGGGGGGGGGRGAVTAGRSARVRQFPQYRKPAGFSHPQTPQRSIPNRNEGRGTAPGPPCPHPILAPAVRNGPPRSLGRWALGERERKNVTGLVRSAVGVSAASRLAGLGFGSARGLRTGRAVPAGAPAPAAQHPPHRPAGGRQCPEADVPDPADRAGGARRGDRGSPERRDLGDRPIHRDRRVPGPPSIVPQAAPRPVEEAERGGRGGRDRNARAGVEPGPPRRRRGPTHRRQHLEPVLRGERHDDRLVPRGQIHRLGGDVGYELDPGPGPPDRGYRQLI